ncbi:phage tail tip lysozyme [uncultured Oscillibacter sp.]|uniref:phage tail tip lysozyme n=1 Tax=uncultured Oscillibacter sp. TaxID=876091 RepID=UPI00260EC6B3|nr:phage tail tip lysozyme [uncultured Oscillibacter sp.]
MDSGAYTNFVYDGAGYGLAQWTNWSRKKNLLAYAKSKGKSVGDLEMQLEFLLMELTINGLMSTLKMEKTVREASDIVLLKFERPANQA